MKTIQIASLFFLFAVSVFSARSDTETLRGFVSDLIKIEQQISNEQLDWKEEKSYLSEKLKTLKKQKEIFIEKKKTREESNETVIKKINRFEKEISNYKKQKEDCESQFQSIYPNVVKLTRFIPDSLREDIEPFLNKIDNLTLSLSERLMALLELLKVIETLNHSITLKQVVMTPPSQKPKEFSVLYIGLSQAFCLSMDQKTAGYAALGSHELKWIWDNTIAPKIKQVIDIHSKKSTASFVTLPTLFNEGALS